MGMKCMGQKRPNSTDGIFSAIAQIISDIKAKHVHTGSGYDLSTNSCCPYLTRQTRDLPVPP